MIRFCIVESHIDFNEKRYLYMYTHYPLNTLLRRKKDATFLKEGSSRKVYDLNDGYILKVAKNRRGIRECSNEHYIYNHIPDKYKKYLCPVIQHEDKYIVMPKIQCYWELVENNDTAYFNFDKKILKQADIQDFIKFLIGTYQINDFDLYYAFNWGYYENQIVLLDYGEHYFQENLSLSYN